MLIYQLLFILALGLVIALAFNIQAVLALNALVIILGAIALTVGGILLSVGYRFAQRDVEDSNFYLSTRPVQEKMTRMAPGCLADSLGLIYLLLGIVAFVLQGIAFIR